MLTKELIKLKFKADKISPNFIDTGDEKLLQMAERLVDFFDNSVGMAREEILEELDNLASEFGELNFVLRGLAKLIFDRCEFFSDSEELENFRQKVFSISSQVLKTNFAPAGSEFNIETLRNSYKKYMQEILHNLDSSSLAEVKSQLYADLPNKQKLLSFKKLSARQLLNRYNISSVQWLLLHCKKMSLLLKSSDVKFLRLVVKSLRFHQLVAKINSLESGDDFSYEIVVDGPLSLFSQTKKYGMNLARFFSSILVLNDWKILAQIHLRRRGVKSLELWDNSSFGGELSGKQIMPKFEPYYRHFQAYVPEEAEMFKKLFNDEKNSALVNGWRIEEGNDFLQFSDLGAEVYCFPDFKFRHKDGKFISLEIFHNWHDKILQKRILQVEKDFAKTKQAKLLIAVANSLAKKKEIANKLENSSYFPKYGLTFHSMPTLRQVSKCLRNLY